MQSAVEQSTAQVDDNPYDFGIFSLTFQFYGWVLVPRGKLKFYISILINIYTLSCKTSGG